jgi:hypothetical protein
VSPTFCSAKLKSASIRAIRSIRVPSFLRSKIKIRVNPRHPPHPRSIHFAQQKHIRFPSFCAAKTPQSIIHKNNLSYNLICMRNKI